MTSDVVDLVTLPTTHWEHVDAARARELLKSNHGNRRVDRRAVQNLARDMMAGRFPAVPDTVGFDVTGRMTNAQHRLLAIIDCADQGHPVSVVMGVTYGLPVESFDVTDQGRVRPVSQVLAAHGIRNSRDVAAAAALVLRCRTQSTSPWAGQAPFTKAECEALVLSDADRWSGLGTDVLSRLTTRRIFNRSALLALAYLVETQSERPEMWSPFLDGLVTGEGLFKGDPRLALRQWAERNYATSGGAIQQPRMVIHIKAWNAYAMEKQVQVLRWGASEPFPSVA